MKLILAGTSVGGLPWSAVLLLLLQMCCSAAATDTLLLSAASCSSVCSLDKRSALCTQCIDRLLCTSREPLRFGKRFLESVQRLRARSAPSSNAKGRNSSRKINELILRNLLHLRLPETFLLDDQVSQGDEKRETGSSPFFLSPTTKVEADGPNHGDKHREMRPGKKETSLTMPVRSSLVASGGERLNGKNLFPVTDDRNDSIEVETEKMDFWKEFEARL